MSTNSSVARRWTKSLKPTSVTMTILAAGLILGIVAIAVLPAVTRSAAVVTENEYSVPPRIEASTAAAERGTDFDFLDHELMIAGGYGLRPATAAKKGTDFDFLDHELMRAGAYGLRPAAAADRGTDFDFLDHELVFAGGYGLRLAAAAERGADFYFLDHELMVAGGYTLAP